MHPLAALARAETERAARAFAGVETQPADCNCQCHTTFLPHSERRSIPKAVDKRLCQTCYDEFYGDWSTIIDSLVG